MYAAETHGTGATTASILQGSSQDLHTDRADREVPTLEEGGGGGGGDPQRYLRVCGCEWVYGGGADREGPMLEERGGGGGEDPYHTWVGISVWVPMLEEGETSCYGRARVCLSVPVVVEIRTKATL